MQAKDSVITVLDFETTGSMPGWPDQPWQIGMVTLNRGQLDLQDSLDSLLHVQDRPFNPAAPGNHRLLKMELASAPSLADLWPQIEPRIAQYAAILHRAVEQWRAPRPRSSSRPAGRTGSGGTARAGGRW